MAIEDHAADDLVDGIVATDVFAHELNRPISVECRCGMDGPGLCEELLLTAHRVGDLDEQARVERFGAKRNESVGEPIYCVCATDPTRR